MPCASFINNFRDPSSKHSTMKLNILTAILFIVFFNLQDTNCQSQITLTSDQQVIDLMEPDKVLNLSRGRQEVYGSLRQGCESAQTWGHDMLRIKYDVFYRQSRNPLDKPGSTVEEKQISVFQDGMEAGKTPGPKSKPKFLPLLIQNTPANWQPDLS